MPELETVDRTAVEILSAGGPVHGVGSPPGGDFWTVEELEGIAAANRALEDEIKPPAKIGHSDKQTLVENSAVTDGEQPAVGWLTNFRVDGKKLLADIKRVPKAFDELIEAGAYRTRSVELSKVTSQKTGQVYDWVVTGLAWLGGKLPAVQTLDDVVALYERQHVATDFGFAIPSGATVDGVKVVLYEVGDVVWNADEGLEALRERLHRTLNPEGQERFWIRDVAARKALVEEGWGPAAPAFVVSFQVKGGELVVTPRERWKPARQEWVETAVRAASRNAASENRRAAESRATMPELTLSQDAAAELAGRLGLTGDLDESKLLEAAEARQRELDEARQKAEERKLEADESMRQLAAKAEAGERAERKLYEMERDGEIDGAIKAGKFDPAQREHLQKLYDADAETTRAYIENATVRDELVRELGRDTDEDQVDADAKQKLYEQRAARLGLSAEDLA